MQIATEKQQKQRQRTLESLTGNRWAFTALYVFFMGTSLDSIIKKRSQWPHLFQVPLSLGPLWHSVWENIFTFVCMSLFLVLLWRRIYNYRREQLAAEQEALRKAATPVEGVSPPPPQSLV